MEINKTKNTILEILNIGFIFIGLLGVALFYILFESFFVVIIEKHLKYMDIIILFYIIGFHLLIISTYLFILLDNIKVKIKGFTLFVLMIFLHIFFSSILAHGSDKKIELITGIIIFFGIGIEYFITFFIIKKFSTTNKINNLNRKIKLLLLYIAIIIPFGYYFREIVNFF